jgi:UDP-N-acetylmuramoyl-tripeptide--D-alanyl-D-alanine ligase
VIKRTFRQIVRMTDGESSNEKYADIEICGVSKDTRSIEKGCLYIPIIGARFDGHEFVEEAISKGAAAAFWQRDHADPPKHLPLIFVDDSLAAMQRLAAVYRNSLPVKVIGITGSNGKTSTKDMVAAVLSTRYKVHKTEGNLNGDIGLPLMILQLEEDTDFIVLEMGMRGRGEIELLTRIARPHAAVITNVGEAHIERLGSREEIARAKMEIVLGLASGGLFVYPGNEPLLRKVMPEFSLPGQIMHVRFGDSSDNDIYPMTFTLDRDSKGTYFTINDHSSSTYFIPMLGRHNVHNALAAVAVGRFAGVEEDQIARGLGNMKATGMRIEAVKSKSGFIILNDAYNASPTAMRAALRTLEEMNGYDRKFVVLGDMLELGGNEREYHQEIGRLLNPANIHYVFTYGKLAAEIGAEAGRSFPSGRVITSQSKEDIVSRLSALLKPNDVVLIKGSRGMKLEEVVQALIDK